VGGRHESDFTYRPCAERLVHVDVDVVIDVIVVEIIAGGVGGVVVARVMIRLVAIVVLAVLVQHHRGEHVGRARRARGAIFQESFRDSLTRVSSHDSNRPPRPTGLEYGNSSRQPQETRENRVIHRWIRGDLQTFCNPSEYRRTYLARSTRRKWRMMLRFDVIAKKCSEERFANGSRDGQLASGAINRVPRLRKLRRSSVL